MVTVIYNARIMTMNPALPVIEQGAVAFEDGIIQFVGTSEETLSHYGSRAKLIDAQQKALLPGLVNMHTHAFQVLVRGLCEGMVLEDFLAKAIYPLAGNLGIEEFVAAAKLSALESILTGCTCIVDNLTMDGPAGFEDQVVSAYQETGIRTFIALGLKQPLTPMDSVQLPVQRKVCPLEDQIINLEALINGWNNDPQSRVKFWPSPVTVFACGKEPFHKASEISRKYSVPVQAHIAETRSEVEHTLKNFHCREVEFLQREGVLDPNFQLVHSVWVTEDECKLIAAAGAHVIHCPVSNAYLGSGTAPLVEMLKHGINIALGTDGAVNTNQDMFDVIKMTALVHRGNSLDPTVIMPEKVLEMATLGGARACGLEDQIGSIEPGKKADLIMINLKKPNSVPSHNLASSIVFGAKAADVEDVFIEGEQLLKRGIPTAIDQVEIVAQVEKLATRIKQILD